MKFSSTSPIALLLALVGPACVVESRAPAATTPALRDLSWFLRRLHDVSTLPELEASATRMESTWDRSGGNADCCDYRRLSGNTNVLLDVDGPGCVHRFYTGALGSWVEGTRIQIFLDHAATPLIDMPVNEFFSESGAFPQPLMVLRSYPGSHFPIPFARHCRVQLVGNGGYYWGGYWQLTYTRYPDDTPVESLHLPLRDRDREELGRTLAAWSLATRSPAALPAGLRVLRDDATLAPGATREVRLDGAGVIRELRVAVTPRSAMRDLTLRLTWDGDATPAADLRVGDLFGLSAYSDGDDRARYSSLLMGSSGDEAWMRFPMPYARGARVVVESRATVAVRLVTAVSVEDRSVPANWGRFHIDWTSAPAATERSERVQGIPTHAVLDARGPGKYVGVMLAVDWHTNDWWGEGDWIIGRDGEAEAGYHGTGTEEYFNSGWYRFDRGAVSGFITFQPDPVAVYSFHLNDAFQFSQGLRVLAETVGDPIAEGIIARDHPAWSTAAFWYSGR